MSISFERALGNHEQALNLRVKRAEVLANNLANADTPGFKAQDLNFKAMLNQQIDQSLPMATTSGKHLPHADAAGSSELLYRQPTQPSLDGNTVDSQVELAEFMKNTMDFQASFQFLNSKFKGLMGAIKGE
jgi:flagellar basal-body rod protein FlgB